MSKVLNLHKESGFDKISKYYNNNVHEPWDKWLEVEKIFSRPGKQGLVGILRSKKDKKIKYVFKISQYVNYLIQHELVVLKALNNLSTYCPHFCRGVGGIISKVDPKISKNTNPFKISSKYPIEKEVLLMENIPKTSKMYNYIRSNKVEDKVLYSTIKQVLIGINIAQEKKKFTHYDLHSNNVMLRKCDKDTVFLYVNGNNHYCVPTFGYYPVVIDFGFSYINKLDEGYLWPSMGFTNIGFTSHKFDKFADPKLFLVTVSEELEDLRPSETSKKLSNIVKNIFSPLKIDWNSGWDISKDPADSDYVRQLLSVYSSNSELFDNYGDYCIDILQSLIALPLQEQNYKKINVPYKAFLKEFVKIENSIGNTFYCLYLLKNIVDIAREIRPDYGNPKTRGKALKYFQKSVYACIDSITKYCRPKEVHFEKMLCSLYCLSKKIEGVLYSTDVSRNYKKQKQYRKMPVKNIEEIYSILDVNIPLEYKFNEDTVITVIDANNETCNVFELNSKDISTLNSEDIEERGDILYDIYKNIDVK